MEKKYPKLEDVLSEGKHRIKLFQANEWDKENKKFIKGTHRHGVTKTGKPYWSYNTKVGETYVGVVAWDDEQKALYDKGEVEVNVVHKVDRATKEPIWVVKEGKPVKTLTAYINPIR